MSLARTAGVAGTTVTENPYFVVPLAVLGASTVGIRCPGALGFESLRSWRHAARYGLACMFAVTSLSHFTAPRTDLIRLVPGFLPYPAALVSHRGIRTRRCRRAAPALGHRAAAVGLVILLVAMFPANVVAAHEGLGVGRKPATPLWFRALVQSAGLALLLWTPRPDHSGPVAPGSAEGGSATRQ